MNNGVSVWVWSALLSMSIGASAESRLEGAVRSFVLVKFSADAPAIERQAALNALRRKAVEIDEWSGFQCGVNNSPEGLDQSFTHGFVVTYPDRDAVQRYRNGQDAEELRGVFAPLVERVFVFDLEVEEAAPAAEPGRTHHLVFFRYKASVNAEKRQEIMHAFRRLPLHIPGLIQCEAGTNVGPVELGLGFDHGYLLTYVNARARDDYLPHPKHQEFVDLVKPELDGVLVLDFTVAPADGALFVTQGLEPYRVYQRNAQGVADIAFAGTSGYDGVLQGRVLKGRRIVPEFDWQPVGEVAGGVFDAQLTAVPVGGEYSVELRQLDRLGNVIRSTSVHHVLVGDLWILAGQSNMQGVGLLHNAETPSDLVHVYSMAHRWELAVEPLHWLVDSPDVVHSGRYFKSPMNEAARHAVRDSQRTTRSRGAGLGLPFAKELVRRTGVPVGLIASAHGGTSTRQWDPQLRDKGGESLYGSMYKQVLRAGGKVRGVLWYQGEADANRGEADGYFERLRGIVDAVRSDLGDARLSFYLVQLGRFPTDRDVAEGWNSVQEAQRRIADELLRTAVVPAIDLQLDDRIHIGTDGLKRLGHRLAKVAHSQLSGGASLSSGPRLTGIQVEEGGDAIRVSYRQVNGRLLPEGHVAGFSIADGDGNDLPIIYRAQVDPEQPHSVLIRLSRPIAVKNSLSYGKGLDPVCNLVDTEDMAAPVFGPLEIPSSLPANR